VAALEEMIQLIQGLNRSTGREVGLYIEPKSPDFHHREGRDVMAAVLSALHAKGLSHRDDKVYLQSFDMAALQRARRELKTELQLVQLIGENDWGESASDFDYLQTPQGLAEVAEYAAGIGPSLPQIISPGADGRTCISPLVETAHAQGLFVHAYTLRADRLPPPFTDLKTALDTLIGRAGLDGVFTDHPDQVVRLGARHLQPAIE
jgi:glycerophosphoryl diester phosphodiesterase